MVDVYLSIQPDYLPKNSSKEGINLYNKHIDEQAITVDTTIETTNVKVIMVFWVK